MNSQRSATHSAVLPRLEPLRFVRTGVLEIAYFEAGPADGYPVILLHGFPYDIHSYVDVIPALAAAGFRALAPYLRGYAPTTFLGDGVSRTGQQATIGADLVDFMDSLAIPTAMLGGYDWGGRAACIAAALRPDRCTGLVSLNGYLIQDLSESVVPISPWLEAGFWYFYYFATERGRAGLTANRREIARVIWTRNSPEWQFTSSTLDRAATAFAGPDLSKWSYSPTAIGWDSRPAIRRTPKSKQSSRTCHRSRSRPSRSTDFPTGTSQPPTGRHRHIASWAQECTDACRARVTTCRRSARGIPERGTRAERTASVNQPKGDGACHRQLDQKTRSRRC